MNDKEKENIILEIWREAPVEIIYLVVAYCRFPNELLHTLQEKSKSESANNFPNSSTLESLNTNPSNLEDIERKDSNGNKQYSSTSSIIESKKDEPVKKTVQPPTIEPKKEETPVTDQVPSDLENSISDSLSQSLQNVIIDCDKVLWDASQSQESLKIQISVLSTEIDKYLQGINLPTMQPYIDKLENTRKKINKIDKIIKIIQTRIKTINKMIETKQPSNEQHAWLSRW